MQEEWKTYRETSYYLRKIEVSNWGNVKLGGKLKAFKVSNKQLYYKVCGMYVHRLVAELFVSNPDNKPEIDHIDTNRHNNNANNLRWVTRKENLNNPITLQHYSKCNKGKNKSKHWKDHMSPEAIKEWRRKISENNPMQRPEVRRKHSESMKGKNKGKHRVYRDDGTYYMSF